MKNALILLAGGIGKRMKSKVPKQFFNINNTNIIEYFLSNLEKNLFDIIMIVIANKDKKKYLNKLDEMYSFHNIKFCSPGVTRQLSSKNALKNLKKYKPKNVLIHDSARPLTSNNLIKKIIKNLNRKDSCIPFVSHNDLIKTKNNKIIKNDEVINIQTPQGFNFNKIYKAHMLNKNINHKDDSTVLDELDHKLSMIRGEISNIKITTKEDWIDFNQLKFKKYRSGIGYDIHRINFKSKKQLILCGIKIKHPPLIGHSDADVGYHAICDSILGSLSLKDIGHYFNNKNDKWKNKNSKIFLKFCYRKLIDHGYKIVNLDINFICEEPNISKIASKMKLNISKIINTPINNISIKATTNEKTALIGRGEAIAAEAIIQITNV